MGRILPLLLIVSLTVSRISCEEPNFPSNYASNYNYDSSSPPEEPGFENEPPQHRGLEEEPELGVVEDQIPMGTGESPQLPQFMQGFPTRNDNRQGSFGKYSLFWELFLIYKISPISLISNFFKLRKNGNTQALIANPVYEPEAIRPY